LRMRIASVAVLFIAACLAASQDSGISDEAISDLGVFGVDLVNTEADRINTGDVPSRVRVRLRDIKESRQVMNGVLGYLYQFGFMEKATKKTEEQLEDKLSTENDVEKAIRGAQRFHGLPVTGVADDKTLRLMQKSRCGVKDTEYVPPNRAKRYTLSRKKWGKHLLKYWFDPEKYSEDMEKVDIRSEFEKALKMWADVADISFHEVETEEEADIKILFGYGDHGDRYPFYGPGGTLAHAFYPYKGLLHFDDAEHFTKGTIDGINLHFVAAHELGHILGIKHADASLEGKAIMYPIYTGYSDDLQLGEDDIAAAVDALGPGSGTVTPLGGEGGTVKPITTPQPETPPECIEKIDGAFHWDSDPAYVYVFAGAWYYRLMAKDPARRNLLPVYDTSAPPKRIGIDGFIGLPRKIDALVETVDNANRFYAFKGSSYFVYDISTSSVVETGQLSDLWSQETPAKIDGALKVNSNTLGFLVGDRLYKYSGADDSWIVGEEGTNYFKDLTGLDALSLAFYRKWTWVFRGEWYSVGKSTSGKLSSNYKYRLIKNDIKLPMCQEGAGELNTADKKACKKELKKFKKKKGYQVSSLCQDYVAEHYSKEIDFKEGDFE